MLALGDLLRRRWWVIVTLVALAVGASAVYAGRQQHVYESTATLYIHPAGASNTRATPAQVSSELSELTYGSLVNTVASMAQSRSTLRSAASALSIPADRLSAYTVVATVRPKSFVLDVSVDGPDRRLVVVLANRVSQTVTNALSTDFRIITLTSLDVASTSSLVRPRVSRDLVYGGLAGLIIGFVLAACLGTRGAGSQIETDALAGDGPAKASGAELPAAPLG